MRYFFDILIALDQLGTTIAGGWPDETMSSYAWRMESRGRLLGMLFRPFIDYVALRVFNDADHCHNAYLAARARVYLPPEMR